MASLDSADPKDVYVLWTRLEPRPRDPENLTATLAAPIGDPLWMLTRQWQTGEFQGEDAGAPAHAKLTWAASDLHLGPTTAGTSLAGGAAGVAEAAVCDEARGSDWALRAQLGQELAYALDDAGELDAIDALRRLSPLVPRDPELPGEARASLVMEGGLIDGVAVCLAVAAHTAPLSPAARGVVAAVAASAAERYPSVAAPPARSSAWVPSNLRYSTTLSANAASGPAVLDANPEATGTLEWHTVDLVGETLPEPPAGASTTVMAVPARVRVPGMPAARWWDFEDSARSLVSISGDERDLARVLWLDFLLVASHHWFVAPLPARTGQVVWLQKVEVIDVFGRTTNIPAADASLGTGRQARGHQRWSLFRSSCLPNTRAGGDSAKVAFENLPKLGNFLVVPPGLGPLAQSGDVLEEVEFLRDEMANLVWAVEQRVQDRLGRPVSARDYAVHGGSLHEGQAPPTQVAPDSSAPLRYLPRTAVPPHWTPFLPFALSQDQIVLRRAVLLTETGERAQGTRGRILGDDPGVDLNEAEVPRLGTRITRVVMRGRGADGGVHTWTRRARSTGSGPGSSGLRFDVAVADTDDS